MVVTLVYNMVDTFFVAGTQNASLVAGVSQCTPLFMLMLALGDIFGLGGSSLISRLFGQKDDETARNVSGFCFYAAIVCGLIVTVLMFAFQGPVLRVLGATSDTLKYASQYYFWIALGAPLIILSLTPSNIIRTEGLAMQSMIASVAGSILNIVLDPIFIFTLGMGAGGAALATVLGYVLSDVLLVCYIQASDGFHQARAGCAQVRDKRLRHRHSRLADESHAKLQHHGPEQASHLIRT